MWLLTFATCVSPDAWVGSSVARANQQGNAFGRDADANAGGDSEELEPLVFLASDRGRERLLDRAKRLAADGRWSDAAAAFDDILSNEQDAFVDGSSGGGSIRSQAAAMIAGFPRPGREAYLLLFRTRAEKRLAKAIETNDREAMAAVARRWFETPAGRHAALVTALNALEDGQPLVAAMWLDRIASSDSAIDFEPTLSVIRAVARRQNGDVEGARELLARAASSGRGIRVARKDLLLSAMPRAGAEWLDELASSTRQQGSPSLADWLQHRGNPSRNLVVDASKPLLVPRYRVPLVRHPDEARGLEQRRRAAADAGSPLMPAGSALAVGDFLVVHTPLGILAIEFETGKRLWIESSVVSAELGERADAGVDASDRVFDDATSGNLASDGRLVFAVEIPPDALTPAESAVGGFGFGRGLGRPPTAWDGGNVLRAYDIAGGGVLRWQAPEPMHQDRGDSTEPATWFSGAPLVAGHELYVLAEEAGEVRLECRNTEDGHLRWQQPLASYDDRETITNPETRNRRLAGLTPSLIDGVIICPLGAGCVVALDTATRSLLWSHTYARIPPDDGGQGGASLPSAGEPSAVLFDGIAVLAPYDAQELFCLRVRDGKPAWPQPKRGRYRVAGIVDRRLVVVSDTAVESLDVATGNRVWKLPLGDLGRPSGRGIFTPNSLLLPLDTPEVLEIGLADGRVKGRSPSRGGSVPGNLVAHRGEIISRGVEFLEVFHQEAALESRIETARAGEQPSAWASYWGGQIAIEEGDVKRGLDLVAHAVSSQALKLPPGEFSATLVRALDRDFSIAASWQARDSQQKLDPSVNRRLVDGFLASGDASRAWQALQPLLEDDRPRDDTVFRDAADPWLVITADRWNRGRIKRIAAMADGTLAGRIDSALGDEAMTSRTQLTKPGSAPVDIAEEVTEAAAWPLGTVARTLHSTSKRPIDHGRMHPIPLALAGAGRFGTRTMQATLDGSQRRLVITDGLGNAIGAPIPLEGLSQELMPWVNRTSAIEVAVVGTTLFVRTRKELAAYDLDAGPGRGRGLWRRPDQAAVGDPAGEGRWTMGVGGRVARDGWVPLGMRISEPDETPRGDGRGMVAMPGFVVVPGPRSIALLDPATGRLLWERRRLPPGLEWTVDEHALCGLTNDGARSVVLDTIDGQMLHQIDLPHRRQRLVTHGRCVVAIRSIDELPGRFTARRVRLELIDPATRQTRSLGDFSGDARATEAGPGRLAVMEPGGNLTLIDLETPTTLFRTTLPDPPRQFARLIVQPWHDRYLVLAGSPIEGEDAAGVSPLQQLMLSSPASAPMSGRLWAVDRTSGESLWQAPALIDRHCLHTAQPPDLPILAFCRLIHGPGERDQTRLSLLMLDKRTGHAVLDDDRIAIPSHAFLGCEIAASPGNHTVTIAEPAGGAARLTLTFTGAPIPPQAPYRGAGRLGAARATGRLQTVGQLFEQAFPDDDRGDKTERPPLNPEEFE
jgi:outer membrane protein assembly factor BamB